MPFGLTCLRRKKSLHKIPGGLWPDDAAAQTNDVHVIILDALSRREVIEYKTGSHSRNLVRTYRSAHTAPTNGNSPVQLTGRDGLPEWDDEIRIVVIGAQNMGAE